MILVVEALFTLVFVWSVALYVRDRDRLQLDVSMVFACVGLLSILDVIQRLSGPAPIWVSRVTVAILLAQPYLTLHLTSRLRPVPVWLRWSALIVVIGTALPLVFFGARDHPMFVLIGVAAFVIVDLIAAAFLAAEARRRTGSPRVRLMTAAVATVLFGLALFVAGAGTGTSNPTAFVTASRGLALAAAIGYLVAFLPPAWLRRGWSASAAYAVSQHLMAVPTTEGGRDTWTRFAKVIRQTAGADAAVVLIAKPGGGVEESSSGFPGDETAGVTAEALEKFVAGDGPYRDNRGGNQIPELARPYAERVGAKFAAVVPLRMTSGGTGVLVLLNRYNSLFAEDDIRLLGELGAHAAVVAERESVLTEQRRLTGELTASLAALTAASKAKNEFFSNMSHELRTPLNAIIGFSDLMRAEETVGPRKIVPADWVEHVFVSGHRLLNLVDDILDISKADAGKIQLRLEPVMVSMVVDEAVATLRPLMDSKKLVVSVSVPPLMVMVDPGRFRQMIDNLLSNAIKFTPDGGTIQVRAVRRDGSILISVVDSGIGIRRADQQRVFDDFEQVGDPQAQQSGTGLGLALTQRLVRAHGGQITLTSDVGRGADFTISLPDTLPNSDVAARDGAPVAEPAGRGGILLIEDDPIAVELLRTYLDDAGYRVFVASNGEDGLALARQQHPSCILLDVLLPGMDGWEVLKQLKSDPALREIPVIIISVIGEKEIALALGAVDYFLKPIDPNQLLGRLEGLSSPESATTGAVLVIDDDAEALAVIRNCLTEQGYDVVTAASEAACRRLSQGPGFNLIICDPLMQEVDGFAVIATLAVNVPNRSMPILVLTRKDLSADDKERLNRTIRHIMRPGEAGRSGLLEWLDTRSVAHPHVIDPTESS